MRIALLGPIAWRVPPRHYGPWEQVTGLLAEGLVALGHEVTLFATLDSITSATLAGVSPRPYAEDSSMDGRIWEALHVAYALDRSTDFDLVHNHLDWLPLAFAAHCRVPMITTIHGFSDRAILPAYRSADSAYVSISDADRIPELSYLATIHHGIDLHALPFSPAGGDDLVVLGRIHPDKGTSAAITIAARAGRRLLIAGPVADERYFRERVEPAIDGDGVIYLGSVAPQQRAELLGSAHALLHPIGFAEPFGLSVVEAMATGTPVIAYPLGSMPEIIDENVTGFLAADADAAVAAVGRVDELDRGTIRSVAASRFSAERMVGDYVEAYASLLERPQ